MNGDDELPSDYFWASEEAEQEYYAVGQAIAEAEEKLAMARGRMLAASAIADAFPHALNVSSKHHGYSYVYAPSPDNCLPKDYDPLNHALNPYWLWPNGKVEHYGYEPFSAVSFRGSMTLQKIESKTVHAGVGFGRRKKRSGDYVHCTIEYSYEKRVEWYTPTGDA